MDDPHPEQEGRTRRDSPTWHGPIHPARGGSCRAGGGDHRPKPLGGQSRVRVDPRRSPGFPLTFPRHMTCPFPNWGSLPIATKMVLLFSIALGTTGLNVWEKCSCFGNSPSGIQFWCYNVLSMALAQAPRVPWRIRLPRATEDPRRNTFSHRVEAPCSLVLCNP